ncbi:MAG: GNAT family N-acetyltransferase [Deltaproteobacteria bacterium]|nr:GNAT family N-acetyltransferase [Deltaproteobacteria bacterium]
MKISVIAAADLDDGTRSKWRALQASNPALASPYFCPELTAAVAAQHDDVRIAVLEEGAAGGVVGFFPFQGRWGVGRPVGGHLSDHHGVIAGPDTVVDWQQLLKATGLAWWEFDHLTAAQSPGGVDEVRTGSPALDLSRGFAAWKQGRIDAGGRRIAELDRKARKLAREVGPVRFEAHDDDRALFWTVLRKKTEQCRRTGVDDVFASQRSRALVDDICSTQGPTFAGRLSALYAGDTLIAAHLGMRSARAWHWWFPVYEQAFAKHSPGALLLLHTARAAAAGGAVVLDLGKGDDGYKDSFADCSFPLVEGCVTRPTLRAAIRETGKRAKHWARTSSSLSILRPVWRLARGFQRSHASHLAPAEVL